MFRCVTVHSVIVAAMCIIGPGSASAEELHTTKQHLFWVMDRDVDQNGVVGGWTSAVQLLPGDRLLLANGEEAVLRATQNMKPSGFEISEGTSDAYHVATTYNFEVSDTHTYFVGDAGVWVHNHCPEGASPGRPQLSRTPIVLYRGVYIGNGYERARSFVHKTFNEGLLRHSEGYILPRYLRGDAFAKPPSAWHEFPTQQDLIDAILDHTNVRQNRYMISASKRMSIARRFATFVRAEQREGDWASIFTFWNPGTGIDRASLNPRRMTPGQIVRSAEAEVTFLHVPPEYIEHATLIHYLDKRWMDTKTLLNRHFDREAPLLDVRLPPP